MFHRFCQAWDLWRAVRSTLTCWGQLVEGGSPIEPRNIKSHFAHSWEADGSDFRIQVNVQDPRAADQATVEVFRADKRELTLVFTPRDGEPLEIWYRPG
jgi:hypothetical protein